MQSFKNLLKGQGLEGKDIIAYYNHGNNTKFNCNNCKVKFVIVHGFITKAKYNTKGKAMQAAKPSASKNSLKVMLSVPCCDVSIIRQNKRKNKCVHKYNIGINTY